MVSIYQIEAEYEESICKSPTGVTLWHSSYSMQPIEVKEAYNALLPELRTLYFKQISTNSAENYVAMAHCFAKIMRLFFPNNESVIDLLSAQTENYDLSISGWKALSQLVVFTKIVSVNRIHLGEVPSIWHTSEYCHFLSLNDEASVVTGLINRFNFDQFKTTVGSQSNLDNRRDDLNVIKSETPGLFINVIDDFLTPLFYYPLLTTAVIKGIFIGEE